MKENKKACTPRIFFYFCFVLKMCKESKAKSLLTTYLDFGIREAGTSIAARTQRVNQLNRHTWELKKGAKLLYS